MRVSIISSDSEYVFVAVVAIHKCVSVMASDNDQNYFRCTKNRTCNKQTASTNIHRDIALPANSDAKRTSSAKLSFSPSVCNEHLLLPTQPLNCVLTWKAGLM